ncbi:MAG: hypothetical protein WCJ81_01935 [bacterium]
MYKYHQGKIVPAEKKYTADTIYQFRKMADVGQDFSPAKIINTAEFRAFMGNKYTQYEFLTDFFPHTEVFHTLSDIKEFLRISKKACAIIKPVA